MDVVAAAFRVRRRFFGRRVKLNYLVNIKSGLCPEDCFYCSQRIGSTAEVLKYSWLKPDEATATAEAGVAGAAPGLSGGQRPGPDRPGHRPGGRDDRLVQGPNPDVEVCACLGLLSDGQAERLAAAARRVHHNLNTSGATTRTSAPPTSTRTGCRRWTPPSPLVSRPALA